MKKFFCYSLIVFLCIAFFRPLPLYAEENLCNKFEYVANMTDPNIFKKPIDSKLYLSY